MPLNIRKKNIRSNNKKPDIPTVNEINGTKIYTLWLGAAKEQELWVHMG